MENHHHSPEAQELRRHSWGPRSFFWKRVAQGVGFAALLFPSTYAFVSMSVVTAASYLIDIPTFTSRKAMNPANAPGSK